MSVVRILATNRSLDLLPFTLLVFKTLRVGFPTARVIVDGNNLSGLALDAVTGLCAATGCEFSNGPATDHHHWLENLCETEQDFFWVLDTDIIFYESVEGWSFHTALAGWRIPEWEDEFTKCCTRARLHTSLLHIWPSKLRDAIAEYKAQFPVTPFNPMANLFHPLCVPFRGGAYFYDTMAMVYQAVGGTAFSDRQLEAYAHLNFGTIPDVVLPHLSNAREIQEAREAVMKNPVLGKGAWRSQMEYYAQRQKQPSKPIQIPPITQEDAIKAREWNVALCKGDEQAMAMNNFWYDLAHGSDDILDSMEDGRPKMSQQQILSVFMKAMLFYNSPFYVAHQQTLFSVVLQIHNMYADSLEWERSPLAHKRAMADVFRTCGNELFLRVAMIKGGEGHMRAFSPLIRERDWLGQHDKEGNPT